MNINVYGALGNQYFSLYKTEIARSITLLGQCMVNKAAKSENEFVSKVLNEKEKKDRRAYGDTDSVTGDTIIIINDNPISIENFYETCDYENVNKTVTNKFIKKVKNTYKTLSYDFNHTYSTDVKYVMKHKTSKHLYKIIINDTNIIKVTEDHSLMFIHNDELIEGTVNSIEINDLFVLSDGTISSDWNIIDLGFVDDYVYDIETENHMFFANDILVHNSNYFDLTDALNVFYKMKPDCTVNEATNFIDKFCHKIEDDALSPTFEHICKEMNCHENTMHMDREAIAIPNRKTGYSGIWIAKKRYYLLINDMEDYRYEDPHEKIMGLYSVTSNCPEFVKPVYNQVLHDLVTEGVDTARETIKNFKDVFYAKSIEEIAFPKSVSDVIKFIDPKTKLPWEGKWMDNDSNKERNGGVPINSKAAIYHNYLIDKFGLQKKYQYIKNGDHIKYVLLKENPYRFSVIGFHDVFPEEFQLNEYVDYDAHWDKIFYSPINDIFEACNYTIEKVSSIEDFF